MSIQLYVAEKI